MKWVEKLEIHFDRKENSEYKTTLLNRKEEVKDKKTFREILGVIKNTGISLGLWFFNFLKVGFRSWTVPFDSHLGLGYSDVHGVPKVSRLLIFEVLLFLV